VGAEVSNPTTGRSSLYPSNQAHYLDLAAATNLTKYMRLQAVISPGWLHQDERFLPYTTNEAITGCGGTARASCTSTPSLPAPILGCSKQTLAMNFPLVSLPGRTSRSKRAIVTMTTTTIPRSTCSLPRKVMPQVLGAEKKTPLLASIVRILN